MSTYENYAQAAQNYDDTRVPIGLEVILGCLCMVQKPLHSLTVLDAGCGTGSYTRALLPHVAALEAVDANRGMLDVAKGKLAQAHAAGRVAFHQASIDALPNADGSVDAVLINQVLHHLGDTAAGGWPMTLAVLKECKRVLRPGGALVVSSASQRQLRRSWWYTSLLPEAVEQLAARHAPLDILVALIAQAGLSYRQRVVPIDAKLQGAHYLDPYGPLKESFRRGDSLWSLLTEEQLARACARIRALDGRGELQSFVSQHDAPRTELGQVTFLHATRGD